MPASHGEYPLPTEDTLSQPEQSRQSGPNDLPFTIHLINPHGDRHLVFSDEEGRLYRLWQYRWPEPAADQRRDPAAAQRWDGSTRAWS